MTLHVTVQHVEQGAIVIDDDGLVGVRIKGTDPNDVTGATPDQGITQVMFVDRLVVAREVTHRAIFTYTDPEGVRQQFESDVPGFYKFGGPRVGGLARTYRVLYEDI